MSESSNLNLRNPRAELATGAIGVQQKPVISGRDELESETIVAPNGPMHKDYMAELAFAEEPVTIRVEPSGEKNAAPMVDCWVNGRGCEVLVNGRWLSTGFFPVGVVLTTKRKYVEVLARSKVTNIKTKHDDATVANPQNLIERQTYQRAPFSVIEDKNPKGAEWLANLVRYL